MAKSIQSIIADTVSKSKKLFDKGDILEAPARIDVMTAMIIDAHQGKLKCSNAHIKFNWQKTD